MRVYSIRMERPEEYFFAAPKRRRVVRRAAPAPARRSVGRRYRAAKVSRSDDSAYCLRCRHKIKMSNPRTMTTKRGTPFLQGTCPHCRSKVARFQKASQW